MSLGAEVVEQVPEGFVQVIFRDVNLPEIALFQVSMVTEGTNDSIRLLAACEYLLEDGDDVGVEVALTGEGVDDARAVDLSCCE